MNTTQHIDSIDTTFTTCSKCGYIISQDEEICESCKKGNASANLSLW